MLSWRPRTVLPPAPGLPCPTPAATLAAPLAPEHAESCRAGSCQDSASFSHPKIRVFVSCQGCGVPWFLGAEPLSCPLLHAAGVCPSGPSSRVLQQCRCWASAADTRGGTRRGWHCPAARRAPAGPLSPGGDRQPLVPAVLSQQAGGQRCPPVAWSRAQPHASSAVASIPA